MTTTIGGSNPAVTFPDGTIQNSANNNFAGPAFSYFAVGTQSVTGSVSTKVLFATKDFDTANSVTSSKFQPTTSGYYQINNAIALAAGNTGICLASIYKNGTEYKRGVQAQVSSVAMYNFGVSGLVFLNGSTDYVEIYTFTGGASTIGVLSYFDGSLVRVA